MPDKHDDLHSDLPNIDVTAPRPNNELSSGGGGGGPFYNFGGGHDTFTFNSPFFSDGGGDGGGGHAPDGNVPEIVVSAPREPGTLPLTAEELTAIRDSVFDFLEFAYHGYYRFETLDGTYALSLFDYANGQVETYIFDANGGLTYVQTLDPNDFSVPDGVWHTGPDLFELYRYDDL
jgi:hypothetical protein